MQPLRLLPISEQIDQLFPPVPGTSASPPNRALAQRQALPGQNLQIRRNNYLVVLQYPWLKWRIKATDSCLIRQSYVLLCR